VFQSVAILIIKVLATKNENLNNEVSNIESPLKRGIIIKSKN
jgi:hypothetical protein